MATVDLESVIDKKSFAHNVSNCGPISQPCVICGIGIRINPRQFCVYAVGNQWELTDDPGAGTINPIGWSCFKTHRDLLEGFVFEADTDVKARMLVR